MKLRMIISIVIFVVSVMTQTAIYNYGKLVEQKLAAMQVEDSDAVFAILQGTNVGLISYIPLILGVALVFMILTSNKNEGDNSK